MSWIAEYDTQGREFPTCVHVTKTTGTMTHGVTYVPIEDGKAVRAENAKLRELLIDAYKDMDAWQMVIANSDQWGYGKGCLEQLCKLREAMRKLGVEEIGGDE